MSVNNQPLVSIVIPCYNHENYVQYCINSIIEQDYPNIELLIIDDGSKDNSVSKICEMLPKCHQRFARVEFRHRNNQGLPATLNEALEWSKGKYISIIASDDAMLPHKTTFQVNYLENNPAITAVSAGLHLMDINNQNFDQLTYPEYEANFADILLQNIYLFAPTQMYKLDALKIVGGYDNSIKIEDWYMWLKLLSRGHRIVFLNECLVQYRRHSNNTGSNIALMREEELKIIKQYNHHPLYENAILRWKLRGGVIN